MTKLHARLAWLVFLALLLAGCTSGSGSSKEKDGAAYVGQFKEFDLYLFYLSQSQRWQLYPGAKAEAFAFASEPDASKATIPGPTIRVREGDTVAINFILGSTPMAHTLHWHGLSVPWDQDGVPYISQAPLGTSLFGGNGTYAYTYRFTVHQSGTYFYHCHVDTQHHMDMGMYGAFIVDPADPDQDPTYDQEETLFLDEWDKSHIHGQPQVDQILSRNGDPQDTADALLGQVRDYYHMGLLNSVEQTYQALLNNPNVPAPVQQVLKQTLPAQVLRQNRTWYPVTYPAYYATYDTFLINGHAFPDTQTILVHKDETLRLRLVNAGSQVHSMHLHGHHFLVTHKDGYKLASPYYADTLLMGPGERYDLYVRLDNPGPWAFHDHMSQNEQNDNINPGGMMTHICYREGWALAGVCQEHVDADGHMHAPTAGELTYQMANWFAATQRAPLAPEYRNPAEH